MLTQNAITLSAAVRELSCLQREKKLHDDAENDTSTDHRCNKLFFTFFNVFLYFFSTFFIFKKRCQMQSINM